METTPEQTAARLDLDERAVMLRPRGTFLPRNLGRAQWSLERAGLLAPSRATPRRVVLSADGKLVRDVFLGDFVDEETGWGILLVGRGEPCWWRPDGKGYTLDVSQAGLYSLKRAREQHGSERGGRGCARDIAIPPARMREMVDAALSKARESVSRLEEAREAVAQRSAP